MRGRDAGQRSLTGLQRVLSPRSGAGVRAQAGLRLRPAPRTFGFLSSQTLAAGEGPAAAARTRRRRRGPGTAGSPALRPGRGGQASPQLPAAGSGGRGRGEGTAGGGLAAPKAFASLSRPRKRGDPAGFSVPVKRDMAARPTSPGGPVCTGKRAGLERP